MISRFRKSRSFTDRWWITTAIRFAGVAGLRYADYLLQTRLKSRSNGLRMIYSITINLVPNHLDKRAHKYIGYVRQSARKYGVDESLILAIMQTESSLTRTP